MSSLGAIGRIDRSVVQTVAPRKFRRKQQHFVALAAHDVLPFAQRLRSQIERGEPDHALHRIARAEFGQRLGVRRQRLADRHDRGAKCLGGHQPVEMVFGREAPVKSRRILALPRYRQCTRLPVAPRRVQRLVLGHRVDRTRHVRPIACPQCSAHPPCALLGIQLRAFGLAIPRIGGRVELPGGLVRDEQIAVQAIGLGKSVAYLEPRVACTGRIGARGAIKGVKRKLASAIRRRSEITFRQRLCGIAFGAFEVPRGGPVRSRKIGDDTRGETGIAGFVREAEARPEVVGCQSLRLQHGREQCLARFGLILPGVPVGARRVERRVAIACTLPLDRVAVEFGIVASPFWVFSRKQRPLLAFGERLQPFAAQAVCERRAGVASEETLDALGVGIIEFQLDLPIGHVLLE